MTTKKFAILLFSLAFTAFVSCKSSKSVNDNVSESNYEQDHRQMPREMREKPDMSRLWTELNLTDSQKKKMDAIESKYMDKMKADMPSPGSRPSGNMEEMRKKMDTMMNKKNSEIKAILTDEQYAIYQEKMEEMHKNRPHPNKGMPPRF